MLNHSDPVVRQVLKTWLPRFLAGGIEIGDIARTIRAIDGWQDWGPRWMEAAALHEKLGEVALVEARTVSAAQAFMMASRCYHVVPDGNHGRQPVPKTRRGAPFLRPKRGSVWEGPVDCRPVCNMATTFRHSTRRDHR